jgi:hypothetical protein
MPGRTEMETAVPAAKAPDPLSSPAAPVSGLTLLSGAGVRDGRLTPAQARMLAPLIGNRALGRVLAREPVAEEKSIVKGPKAYVPTKQYEASYKWKLGDTRSFSLKLTFARWDDNMDTKALKLGGLEKEWTEQQPEGEQRTGAVKAGLSLFEQKSVREQAATGVGNKMQAALSNFEVSGDPIFPGVNFKFNVKTLEYQINRAKQESDLNLITVSGSLEGNITEFVQQYLDVPLDQRAKWRVVVAGEFKWVPSYEDIGRIKSLWKANKVLEAEAKAIKETAEKLRQVEWRRKDMARDLKRARSQVDYLQQQLDEAPENLKRLRAERLERAKGRLTHLEARDRELKEAGDKLSDALKKSKKNMDEAAEAAAKATKGMKGKIGKQVAKTMAKQSAKAVGKFLAKAIPIVNVLSTIYDLYELGKELDQWRRGGKWDPFGDDDGGAAGDGAGEEGGTGPAGASGPPGGGDAGGSGVPDGSVPATDGGAGGDGSGRDGGNSGGTGGTGGDTGAGGGDAGVGPDPTGDVPADASKAPDPALHEKAKSVLDIVRGTEVPLDADVASQLDSIVPKGLTDAQLAELRTRIEKIKGEGISDPYEIIGRIHQEIDRVVSGEPPTEVTINGKRSAEQSKPGTPPAVPTEALTGKPGKRGDKAAEGKPGAGKAAEGAAGDGKAPATKPKKTEPPKSIKPSIPPGYFLWSTSTNEVVLPPDKRDELLGMEFSLGGGLVVGITDITLQNEKYDELTLVTLGFEVIVLNAPRGAGPDYPWKPGTTRFYSERAARDLKSGTFEQIEDAPSQQAAFADALTYEKGKLRLTREGTTIDWPGAKLRIDGLAGEPDVRSDDKKEIHSVPFLITPTEVTGRAMIVTGDGPIQLVKDVQVVVRVEVTVTKSKP